MDIFLSLGKGADSDVSTKACDISSEASVQKEGKLIMYISFTYHVYWRSTASIITHCKQPHWVFCPMVYNVFMCLHVYLLVYVYLIW